MVGGSDLVRTPALCELAAHERESEMRAEELVRRAEQDVCADVLDVDRPMRRVVHGVGPGERARLVRESHDALDVDERAHGVRRERKRDDARAFGQLALEVLVVERRVVVDLDQLDLQAQVLGELEPRRDVPVVVELRREDLVALA